jgi:hypothetical protein
MSKKMMLLAISVVSAAFFVMPAVASATSAHLSATSAFTVTPNGVTELETTGGEKITCSGGVKGSGAFQTTTTGTLSLTFHGCKAFGFANCTTAGQPEGTIATTALSVHLITPEPKGQHAGVLITPPTGGSFAHFSCIGINKVVTGNGVIGTITSPTCGAPGTTTAVLSFEQAATGIQKHTTHTGVNYHLESGGQKAAQIGKANVNFPASRQVICT